MNKGGTVEADGIRVTMVHADHSAGDIYAGAEAPIYLGEPVGLVVELENGFRAATSPATPTLFGDMRLIGERYRPDVAFLPIGGHYTMDPVGAAHAVELLGVKHVAADALRDVPDPRRDAGPAPLGARGARPRRRRGPRAGAGRDRLTGGPARGPTDAGVQPRP